MTAPPGARSQPVTSHTSFYLDYENSVRRIEDDEIALAMRTN